MGQRRKQGKLYYLAGGGLLAFLVAVIYIRIRPEWQASREKMAQDRMHLSLQLNDLLVQILAFHREKGRLPENLEELQLMSPGNGNGDQENRRHFPRVSFQTDPWGSPLCYCILDRENLCFSLASSGPDKTLETGDDFTARFCLGECGISQ